MNAPRPVVATDPAIRADVDLNALAQAELRLATTPLSQLIEEHDHLSRWLNLPFAETWSDQHREKSARIRLVWATIKRRFPEYAAKRTRKVDVAHELGEDGE